MSNAEHSTADSAPAREQLWQLIKDIRFAMFTTRHANGHLHSRPMTTQNSKLDEDSSLWFFMSRAGEPVADLSVDPVVNVVTHQSAVEFAEVALHPATGEER